MSAKTEQPASGVVQDLYLHALTGDSQQRDRIVDRLVDRLAFDFDGLYTGRHGRSFTSLAHLALRCSSICCAIVRMLFTSQYKANPEGKLMNMTVNTSGMNIIIRCCAGSPACGVMRC